MTRTPWAFALVTLFFCACGADSASTASRAPAPAPGAPRVSAPATAAPPAFDPRPFFEKSVLVTDKGAYVHMFWNAHDAAGALEGPDRRARLAVAAAQLTLDHFPAGATSDVAKVDIVFVKERNEYGQPKWDSLQKVAHFEMPVSRVKALAKTPDGRVTAVPEAVFDRINVF